MKDFFKTFGFFFAAYRGRTAAVVGLLILAGLAEAVGITVFLPFLQIVLEGQSSIANLPPPVQEFILLTGLPLTFSAIGSLIAAAIAVKALILWLALRFVSRTVAQIAADLRRRLMSSLINADWRFFARHAMGESLNAVVMESFRASMAFVSATRFIAALIQLIIYALAALMVSWMVFAGGLAIGGLIVFILWSLVKIARAAGTRQSELAKSMLTDLADMLQGIKSLRAMALENKFMQALGAHSRGLEESQTAQLTSSQSMRIFNEPLMVVMAIGGLYLAMTYGHLSGAQLALMTVLFVRLLTAMNNAQGEYQRMVSQDSALWSILDTIGQAECAADHWPGRNPVPSPVQMIRFENVSFSHGARLVLDTVNLSFSANRLTAIVGTSGSGKTTILDLLSGFYLPAQGRITVNGHDLAALDRAAWRRLTGFVPQDVFLFNDTIFENVVMGRDDLGENDVWRALESAGISDHVRSLPQGLYAPVGENGRLLSGGQKQRIAIARAIVHRPQVLLLDEATSALDRETEKVLLDTLKTLARDMTVIFVSHNAAVRAVADQVYDMRAGAVDEAA